MHNNPPDSGEADASPTVSSRSGWHIVSVSEAAASTATGADVTVDEHEGHEGWQDADAVVEGPAVFDGHPAAEDQASVEPTTGADVAPRRVSDTVLVLLGVLGGVYLLYSLGWIVSARRFSDFYATSSSGGVLGDLMMQVTIWLTIAAPAAWFASVCALTRSSRAWVRLVWLVVGAVILVPLPFLFPQMVM
ncbi:hypothetical protein FB466_1421 [Klugiella xanthotipulae]|uniref:DNA polymerase III subunit gamma/tau n=1 Tax=Klugiella xanthotipulae TaxID=244735 RepID=A0A543HXU4_9MICO|nr:hypothetical protein FB466_1421 [Klugiella xanthotipulae]